MMPALLTVRDRYALAVLAGLVIALGLSLYQGGLLDRLSPPAQVEAREDFWLVVEPRAAADRVAFVRASSRLDVLGSGVGEMLDPQSPAPDRWQRVRTGSGAVGWAYAGWLRPARP
jgi:hypothetical protein